MTVIQVYFYFNCCFASFFLKCVFEQICIHQGIKTQNKFSEGAFMHSGPIHLPVSPEVEESGRGDD